MRIRNALLMGAVLTAAAVASVGCGGSSAGQTATLLRAPVPPQTHDAVALYNDSSSTVHVIGCAGCGASGTPLAPGHWLPLNLPQDSGQLQIRQRTATTCLMLFHGIDTGKPLTVKVSESAASAC